MSHRIFILDDDPDLIKIAQKHLEEGGFVVNSSMHPRTGLHEIQQNPPDLLLLDLRLPEMDGFQVCKELKADPKTRDVPIVFLSAQSDESDVVTGLELGADDYITKKFRKNELLARVKAVLRRHGLTQNEQKISYGPFTVDFSTYKAWVSDKELNLTPKEFELFGYFVRKGGRVITRSILSEHVWGTDFTGVSRTVDAHIERLRKKLGSYGSCLKGLKGVGYRFEFEE